MSGLIARSAGPEIEIGEPLFGANCGQVVIETDFERKQS